MAAGWAKSPNAAPELKQGAPLDPRCDLYSLASSIVELASGSPFVNGSAGRSEGDFRAALAAHFGSEHGISDADLGVLAQCLATDPRLRPESADSVLDLLLGAEPPMHRMQLEQKRAVRATLNASGLENDDLAQRVRSVIVDQLGVSPEEVTDGSSFIEDLGADSLDLVELIMALEEEFDMEVPDEDAEKIANVGDAIRYAQLRRPQLLDSSPPPDIEDVSDDQFAELLKSSPTPLLVEFWAPWCGPCKSIAPILSELAQEYSRKLRIVKLNVDENPKTPAEHDVRGIPNFILFARGEKVDQIVGAVPKEQLRNVIRSAL